MPQVKQHLPDLMEFVQTLVTDYQQGKFGGWDDFRQTCLDFYTADRMQTIEAVVPSWIKMASYKNKRTLVHVSSALASLLMLNEYQQASPHQQTLMEWIILFHDVAKEPKPNQKDHTHGFRGAVIAGQALPKLGFAVNEAYKTQFDTWAKTTSEAMIYDESASAEIHDNSKLPQIIGGIDTLFCDDAGLIIKGVLFHMALCVVDDWLNAAPLTDTQIKAYITPDLFPLLRAMMLVDNDAWAFFEPATKAIHNQQTHAEFRRVAQLIGV